MRHNESKIQIDCVTWFRLAYPKLARLLFSVPNGYQTSASQARIAKEEGMTAGVSDLILLFPSKHHHALCIEMKTKTGRQQPSQKLWQQKVEYAGYKYVICRSLDDFRTEITKYFKEDE